MALKEKFKKSAVVARDMAINTVDVVISFYKAHDHTEEGNFREAKREMDSLHTRINTRKAARNPKPLQSGV